MTCVKKIRNLSFILPCLLLLLFSSTSFADPCLVVYPNEVCTYHYDTNEYYTVTVGLLPKSCTQQKLVFC